MHVDKRRPYPWQLTIDVPESYSYTFCRVDIVFVPKYPATDASALKDEPRGKTWKGLEKQQCLVSRHHTVRALFYGFEGSLRINTRLVSL